MQNTHPQCIITDSFAAGTSPKHSLHVAVVGVVARELVAVAVAAIGPAAASKLLREQCTADDAAASGASNEAEPSRLAAAIRSDIALPSASPIGTNPPPCETFNEYRDPLAASDRRLEHREHVIVDDELLRKRFCGRTAVVVVVAVAVVVGPIWLDADRESASTVSHFFIRAYAPPLLPDVAPMLLRWCCCCCCDRLAQLPAASRRCSSGTTLHSFCCTTAFSEAVDDM